MEWLRQTVARIAAQLDVLSRSQKIAILLCAVVVGGSLMWLVKYSAAPEMVPALDQRMTLDEIGNSLKALHEKRITAEQRGDRIYVRPADKDKALLELNSAGALPKDISVGFAEMMADSDPFRPAKENDRRWQVALGNELGRILAASDVVEFARVVIQDGSKRRIGAQAAVTPTASVYVRLSKDKTLDQAMVNGFCRFVGSAVPGLAPHNVTVIDAVTNRPYSAPNPDDILGIGLLEERKRNEAYLREKVLDSLQSIPGVLVSVGVELDASRTRTQKQEWTKPEPMTEETREETTQGGSGASGGEGGMNANVGMALNNAPAGNKTSVEEGRTENFAPLPASKEETEKVPFNVVRATASIGIPRSFLIGIYQAKFGETKDAGKLETEEEFTKLKEAEIARVRGMVAKIIMAKEDAVGVDVFYDFAPQSHELNTFPSGTGGSGGPIIAEAGGGAMGMARQYGVQAGLVVLAFASFLTLARMVRKSSDVVRAVLPPERRPVDEEESEETLHVAGSGPVGRASVPDGLLVGQEVDEDTLRFTQLGDEVTKMVESDPTTAADLIRRWTSNRN
jgi:flagellar biosynthesis/type III secretory pathway M-ring protein FliF/YscJ